MAGSEFCSLVSPVIISPPGGRGRVWLVIMDGEWRQGVSVSGDWRRAGVVTLLKLMGPTLATQHTDPAPGRQDNAPELHTNQNIGSE